MRSSLLLFVAAACTTAKPTPDPVVVQPPKPITAKANAVRARALPFDVSVCAKPVSVRPLTTETLTAALTLEQPRFAECLASPTSREQDDASADVEVMVSSTVTMKVTPRGLRAEGSTCLEQRVQQLGLTGANVTASTVVGVPAGAPSSTLQLLPEVSAVRAAVGAACSCFEPLGVNAPPQLVLTLGPTTPLDVVTAADPLADKVERCLEQTLADFPRPSLELTIDLPLINSDATQESPDASDEVVTTQRQSMKRRAAARLELLMAQRGALVKQLEPIAQSYKRKPTPSLMKQRIALCGELRVVEEALPLAVERAALSKPIDTEPSQLCASVKREE